MYLMNNRIYAVFAILLAGCATGPSVVQYQIECERLHPTFPDMVTCLKESVTKDPRFGSHRSTDLVRLYLAYSDAIAKRVKEGSINETEARLALAELYSRLHNTEVMRATNRAAAYSTILQGLGKFQHSLTPITCIQSGDIINCY
jgi:hypothetical protein